MLQDLGHTPGNLVTDQTLSAVGVGVGRTRSETARIGYWSVCVAVGGRDCSLRVVAARMGRCHG